MLKALIFLGIFSFIDIVLEIVNTIIMMGWTKDPSKL